MSVTNSPVVAAANTASSGDSARCSYGALDGRVFLAHNPVSGNWASRAPLVVSVSDDDGDTWLRWQTLEERLPDVEDAAYVPADSGVATTGANEFSYPSLIATPEGLAVTYTWQRRGIVLAQLDPATEGDR